MGEKTEQNNGAAERSLRFLRDFNIAVGGIALAGTIVLGGGPLAAASGAYAAINFAQAGGYEALRRGAAKQKQEKRNL